MRSPQITSRIITPSNFSVEVELYGEHHMGAEHVELVPSLPISGISRFYSTNGTGFFDSVLNRVFLHDACIILEINPDTLEVKHTNRPSAWYFARFSRAEDQLLYELYSGTGSSKEVKVPYDRISWHGGLGDASEGRFPSAYAPFIRK